MATPSAHLWAFFNPVEPPPAFAAAPEDAATKERILLLARYAMQNGLSFMQTVQLKQAGNPEYDFMKPSGADSQFFRWALYAIGCGLAVEHPLPLGFVPPVPQPQPHMPQQQHQLYMQHPQQQYIQQPYFPQQHMQQYQQYPGMPVQHLQQPQPLQQPPQQQPLPQQQQQRPTPPPIPPEVAGGFSQVLDALTGSKDSIKASQGWFMACVPYAAGMAYMMASRATTIQDFDKLLHLIYLANDILVKAFTAQQQTDGQQTGGAVSAADKPVDYPAMAAAFAPALGVMLAAAQASASSTANEPGQQKLNKMLTFWQEKGLFSPTVMARLQQDMALSNATAALLANYPSPQSQQQQQQQPAPAAPPPGGPGSGWGPPPQAAAPQTPAAVSGWGPVPAAAAPPGLGPIPTPSPSSGSGWGAVPGTVPPAGVAPPAAPPGWPAAVQPTAQPGAMWGAPAAAYPGAVPHQYPAAAPSQSVAPGLSAAVAPQYPAGVLPGMPPAAAPAGAPPQQAVPQQQQQQQPPATPEPEPISSFSFPPGLIPQLVRDKSKYSEPYAPMDPLEIENAGLPPPPEKDAYLKSRINKFAMDIRDYKPGSSRADLEEARASARAQQGLEPDSDEELALGSTGSRLTRRKALGLGAGGAEGRRRARLVSGGMADDGSYVGPGGGGRGERLGLGAHNAAGSAAQLGDVYSSYRRLRSTSYHEMIVGGKGVSNMAKGGH